MDPAKLYGLLQTLTSTGFKTDSFEFKLPLTTKYQISKKRSDIIITFSGDLPTVTVKKYMHSTKRFYNKFLNPLMIICFKLKFF